MHDGDCPAGHGEPAEGRCLLSSERADRRDAHVPSGRRRPVGGHRGDLAGPGRVPRGVGPPEAPRGRARRRTDRRPAAAARASAGPDARPPRPTSATSWPTPASSPARGIEVIRVERGGEVTYHGPGQLVAYPILGLADRGLLLRPLVRALEAALVETCAAFGVAAGRRDGHPGLLVRPRRARCRARSARSGSASSAA